MTDKKTEIKGKKPERAQDILLPRFLAPKIFELTGENYLRSIAEIIVKEMGLGLDYAFVGELAGEKRIRTLSLYALDRFVENMEYDLERTPCDFVAGKQLCIYPRDVQTLFPHDPVLVQMQAQSYMGIPLFSSAGHPLGLIAALGTKPVPADMQQRITAVMQIFGARAAAEIERLQAEQALKKSEKNLRTILDSVYDAIIIHDLNGNVLDVNRKMLEIYRIEREQALDCTIQDLSAPENPIEEGPAIWKRVIAGEELLFEWKAKRPRDRSVFDVEVFLRKITFQSKDVILASVRDISERKRAEQEILKTKEQLEEAQQIAGTGNWEWDVPSNTLTWSNEIYRIFGVTSQDFVPRVESVIAKVHPDDRDAIRTMMRDAADRSREATSVEYRIVRPDGTVRILQSQLKFDYGAAGELLTIKGTVQDVTERHRTEEALRSSEANYREIFESANDGIFVHDIKTGDLVSLNRKASEMYGRPFEEFRHFVDEKFFSGVPGYTALDAMKRIQSAAQGPPQIFEWLSKRKDGRLFWVEVNLKRAVIGGKMRLLAIVRDITDRKRAEEARARLAAIVQTTEVAVISETVDGIITTWNKGAEIIFGYTDAEAIGRHISLLIPAERRAEVKNILTKIARGEHIEHFETIRMRKDGSRFHAAVTVSPIKDDAGRVTGASIITHDVTERRQAEERLEESEQRFRQLAENAEQVFWFTKPDPEQVLYVSPAFESIWGAKAEELYRDPRLWAKMIDPEDRDAVERAFSDWADGKADSFDREYRIVRTDGSIRWIHDRGTMVRDARGSIIRLSGIADDVTERKRIEHEVQQAKLQFEEAQKMAHIGNWERDLRTNRLTWSKELFNIFGLAPDRFKGTYESFIEMVHPEDRAGIEKRVHEAIGNREETASNEYRIVRPNGEIRILHTLLRFEYDNAGATTRIIGTAQDVTESRKAEEALKLTQFSVDHASVSAFLMGKDGTFLYVNEQTCRTLGFACGELLGKRYPDLDPHYSVSDWSRHWEELKKTGGLHFETQHRKKDGTWVPMEMSANYVSFGGREYNWAFGQDISERKRAENSLRQSYNLTETILDSINDPISLIDVRDFTIVRVNRVFLQKYGYSDESEIMGKHCYEITHHRPDVCSAPDDVCPLIETVKTRDHFAVDHVHYDRRGEKIYVEVSTSPVKDEAGNVIQVVHVQRDITERKRAEEALRESEERFRAFFELAAVGTAQVDPATMKFARTNQRFCDMTGYACEELRSLTFNDLTHPEDRTVDRAAFAEMLLPGAPTYDTEKRYVRKDGRIIWVHVWATVVHDLEGRPLHTAAVVQDITERKRMEEEIRHMAHHDALTGLPNRRLFRDIITLELAQAHRNKKKVAVLFIDLDRFKEINDTLGHEAGDMLLKETASRLKTLLRKSDSISRIGGDEFNIILADIVRAEDVSDIARKLVAAFRKPFLITGQELRVTASIGISIYPDDSDQIDALLRYSDIAMYHAKESGRNNFQFYNPSINIRSVERMRLENMLLRSLELGELKIYYQPLVNVSTGRIVCAEALVRWQHPEKGLLLPEDFIDFAEQTGFISAIDEFVLRSVCSQIRDWMDAGLPVICITVNLSSRQFQSPALIEKFDSILRETGIPPDSVNIEITESIAMTDVERSAARMRQLTRMGIHISIDDFGTGYSSLSYLKRLPIEKLKIDKSFIQDIATDPNDRAIISAVTSMAHSMEMKVIAEGVETGEQLSFLRKTNCDEAQGFLFSRPLTAEEFAVQLAETK